VGDIAAVEAALDYAKQLGYQSRRVASLVNSVQLLLRLWRGMPMWRTSSRCVR
jgi:hypothetical protein